MPETEDLDKQPSGEVVTVQGGAYDGLEGVVVHEREDRGVVERWVRMGDGHIIVERKST